MINVHYALQTCDIASNLVHTRYAGENKTEVSMKCVTSYLTAVKYAAEKNADAMHTIMIIDDRSTEQLRNYLRLLQTKYSQGNVQVEITDLDTPGIMPSIRKCYQWLDLNGKDLVFQVQDDYLFAPTAIYEMIDVWYQMFNETDTHSIVSPYNNIRHWTGSYRNRPTARTIIVGANRYWIQYYDMSCSFMTSHEEFIRHWDLYEKFLNLPSTGINGDLESISLNYILTRRGVLGLTPIDTLALHVQHEYDKDPYVDWQHWWNEVIIEK